MSLFKWLKDLFCSFTEDDEPSEDDVEEVVDGIVESVDNEVHECENDCHCGCHCSCGDNCQCENDETNEVVAIAVDPIIKNFFDNLDWDNLHVNDFEEMLKFDLREYGELVDWYKISKFKGLPPEFCINYRDMIDWNLYNKSYLKKYVKELLKEEGRI